MDYADYNERIKKAREAKEMEQRKVIASRMAFYMDIIDNMTQGATSTERVQLATALIISDKLADIVGYLNILLEDTQDTAEQLSNINEAISDIKKSVGNASYSVSQIAEEITNIT